MKLPENTDRRTALKTLGAGVLCGGLLPGTATARGNVVSKVNRAGHYAYFPLRPKYWGRQKHPYDVREGDSRWRAEPAAGGGIQCLVENVEFPDIPNRNAGFDVHMGPLGDLDEIAIDSETVRTQAGSEALLFIGLYLDVDANGEFGAWTDRRGNKERFAGLRGDEEGLLAIPAGETFTIDESTSFDLFVRGTSPTFGDLKRGKVGEIDGETHTALYIGIADKDEGGPEEAIVNEVNIQRS